MNQIQYCFEIKSLKPYLRLYLVANEAGLNGIFWTKQKVKLVDSFKEQLPEVQILKSATKQLEEYFLRKRCTFDIPLNIYTAEGTPFQKKVWSELLHIPYGKTLAYRDIAKKIKNPQAVRAVGTANSKNPFCIIIPCHRVISADGSLGGYSGGLTAKSHLLELEKY